MHDHDDELLRVIIAVVLRIIKKKRGESGNRVRQKGTRPNRLSGMVSPSDQCCEEKEGSERRVAMGD